MLGIMKVKQVIWIFAIGLCAVFAFMSKAPAQKAIADDCSMMVKTVWLQEFTVVAGTKGECGLSELSLVVINGSDEVIWSEAYRPEDLFGFWEVNTPEAMRLALNDWVTTNVTASSTGTLPEWFEGADSPEFSEFPFYPAESVDRDYYETVRAADVSMVCYVQGQESTLCLFQMPSESKLEQIGMQSFPG